MTDKNQFYSLEIKKGNKLLPIGTVVTLNYIQQAVMIYGRKQEHTSTKVIWDYVACPYPQGHMSDETNVFFNHEQINDIIFKGFESEGELLLREKIRKVTGDNEK